MIYWGGNPFRDLQRVRKDKKLCHICLSWCWKLSLGLMNGLALTTVSQASAKESPCFFIRNPMTTVGALLTWGCTIRSWFEQKCTNAELTPALQWTRTVNPFFSHLLKCFEHCFKPGDVLKVGTAYQIAKTMQIFTSVSLWRMHCSGMSRSSTRSSTTPLSPRSISIPVATLRTWVTPSLWRRAGSAAQSWLEEDNMLIETWRREGHLPRRSQGRTRDTLK